jgi:hypothetical protein
MLVTHHQEKNWPAYEAALGNLAKLRVEQYQEQKSANPVELLRQRVEDLSSASAALKQLADAGEPLLNSPDDAEASVFHIRQQRPLIACQAYEKHNGKIYDRRQDAVEFECPNQAGEPEQVSQQHRRTKQVRQLGRLILAHGAETEATLPQNERRAPPTLSPLIGQNRFHAPASE